MLSISPQATVVELPRVRTTMPFGPARTPIIRERPLAYPPTIVMPAKTTFPTFHGSRIRSYVTPAPRAANTPVPSDATHQCSRLSQRGAASKVNLS